MERCKRYKSDFLRRFITVGEVWIPLRWSDFSNSNPFKNKKLKAEVGLEVRLEVRLESMGLEVGFQMVLEVGLEIAIGLGMVPCFIMATLEHIL